ncbi:unnamed protein product [Cuscuta epithymum]|uniref:Nuclear pore complex protein NUP1-like n=1 Tax=Cuscuta epithymum TaxID=186058 RepID=A0AAV0CVG0_9ASTE|nr:unnamed protein product [Cuscuta epithymum]
MEANMAPAGIYNDGDQQRGAGGKFRKPPSRKPPASPYARPLAAPMNKSGRGGWLAKLVDPAFRLISGSATRIMPSFFSNPSSNALPLLPITQSNDTENEEFIPSAKDEEKCSSSSAIKSTERMDANEVSEQEKEMREDGKLGQDMLKSSPDDSKISRIEQLLKGKSFSREEIVRLTELLKSKATEDLEEGEPSMTISGRDILLLRDTPKKSTERRQEVVNRAQFGPLTPLPRTNVQDEIGASPIDVARAFMGSRMSDQSPSHRSFLTKGERDPENAYPSFLPPPLPKPSPCWPTMVSDHHQDLTTPQNQRSRYGLHDFPRTPYSRTLLSKSRTNSRCLDLSVKSSQQSPMSTRGQERTKSDMFDHSYGSVGPIRRSRNKLGSDSQSRKSIFLNPSKAASEIERSLVPKTFVPSQGKNKEASHQRDDTSKAGPNEACRIILEHINRHKPTPKEKAYELNLATSYARSNESSELSHSQVLNTTESVTKNSLKDKNSEKGILQRNSFGNSLCVSNSNGGPSLFSKAESQTNIFSPPTSDPSSYQNSLGTNIVPRGTTQNWSSQQQSNGQNVSTKPENKLPAHTSGTKPTLQAISISKPDHRHSIFSDNTPTGFTFPVPASNGALSEPPPTPSMPSSAAKIVPRLDELSGDIPCYSFGTEKSSQRLVFSFPSTDASVPADAQDIKFNFGQADGKRRLCFSTVGKAVC